MTNSSRIVDLLLLTWLGGAVVVVTHWFNELEKRIRALESERRDGKQ